VDKKNSRFHGLTGELTRPGILIVVRAGVFARNHHQGAGPSLKHWPSWQSNARKRVFTKKTMSQVNHPEIFSNWAAQGRIFSQYAERLYPSPLGSGTSLRRIHHQGYRKDTDRQLRAPMTTDLVDALGFLPAALSTRNWSTDPTAARGRGDRRRTRDRLADPRAPANPHLFVPSPVALGRDVSELTSAVWDRITGSLAPPYLYCITPVMIGNECPSA
jgi:hypothetical protein